MNTMLSCPLLIWSVTLPEKPSAAYAECAVKASEVSQSYNAKKPSGAMILKTFMFSLWGIAGLLLAIASRAPRRISTNRKSCGHKNAAKEAAAQEYIISAIDEFP